MKKLPIAVLNAIVAGICAIALIGFFLFPLWSIKTKISFNEDVAELLLDNMSGSDSGEDDEELPDENDIFPILVEELAEENITLKIEVSIDTGLLMACALSSDSSKVEAFLHDLIDDLVAGIDKKTLEEIEDSIARASVTAAVKLELQELSKDLGEDVEKVMEDIGLDDEYLDEKTDILLEEIRSDDATVDSVTDVVMDVVDDVYNKYGNAYPEDYEPLTPEEEEELRAEIADIISGLADEEGNIDGDGLLSALISGLLEGEELPDDIEEELSAPAKAKGISFAINKYFSPEDESESDLESTSEEQKDLDQVIADTLKDSITEDTLNVVRIIAIGLFAFVFICAFWWLFLIIKILAKIGMRNPLISVKAPIISGCIPFIILVIVPSVLTGMLASPSGAIADMLGKDGVDIMQKLFGGAITVSFSSSSIVSFICAIAMFIFGFFYSSRRRAIKRRLKQEKREKKMSGGLY